MVYSLSGCSAQGCNRFGGDTLTLQGVNFGTSGATVIIGTNQCTNVTHGSGRIKNRDGTSTDSNFYLTCIMPAGAGSNVAVLVLQYNGQIGYADNVTINYLPCDPGYRADGLNCTACDAGSFSSILGATTCNFCARGSYTGSPGQSSCQPCAADTVETHIFCTGVEPFDRYECRSGNPNTWSALTNFGNDLDHNAGKSESPQPQRKFPVHSSDKTCSSHHQQSSPRRNRCIATGQFDSGTCHMSKAGSQMRPGQLQTFQRDKPNN